MGNLIAARPIRVMIVDDHPTVREGLGMHLSAQENMVVCAEAVSSCEAMEKVGPSRPDVVIVDLALKSGDGIDLIREIKQRHPEIQVVVHSMHEETLYAERCLKAGATGYVNKQEDAATVLAAIRTVLDGDVFLSERMKERYFSRSVGNRKRPDMDPIADLTDRQLQVFKLIGEGLRTAEIAERLNLSVHTIESHREHIKRKLGVKSMPELSRRAVQWVLEDCR
jgi:DNA-binding NarL/FixJ family response regulator